MMTLPIYLLHPLTNPPPPPRAGIMKSRVAAAVAGDELSDSESEDDEGGDEPPPTPAYARAFFDDSVNRSSGGGEGGGGGESRDPGEGSNAVDAGGGSAGRGELEDAEGGVLERDEDMMAKGFERDVAVDEMEKERRKCREKDAEQLSNRLGAVSAEVGRECVTTGNKPRSRYLVGSESNMPAEYTG